MFGIAKQLPHGLPPKYIAELMLKEVAHAAYEALSTGKNVTVAINKAGDLNTGQELWIVSIDAQMPVQMPLFNLDTVPKIN